MRKTQGTQTHKKGEGRKIKEKQRESTVDSYSRHKVRERERHSNKAQT